LPLATIEIVCNLPCTISFAIFHECYVNSVEFFEKKSENAFHSRKTVMVSYSHKVLLSIFLMNGHHVSIGFNDRRRGSRLWLSEHWWRQGCLQSTNWVILAMDRMSYIGGCILIGHHVVPWPQTRDATDCLGGIVGATRACLAYYTGRESAWPVVTEICWSCSPEHRHLPVCTHACHMFNLRHRCVRLYRWGPG
jgi:hypothetical protein